MPEDAVMDVVDDAVELDSAEGGENEGGESSESGSEGSEQGKAGESTDTAPVIADANGNLKLSEKARERLDAIKAEDPKLAREMRAALFDRQTLLQKVPGGVKEALATIEAYEAEGGSEAVQQVKQELGLWKDLDADFQKGDPKFVADIAAGNPEAFGKAAPHVMSKYAELDPDGFSYQVSRVFAQDMAANNIALTMERMKDYLVGEDGKVKPGMEGMARQWQALAAYVDRVNGLAAKPPVAKPGAEKSGGNGSDIDQREQALVVREFGSERSRIFESSSSNMLKAELGTRKANETQLSAISELYTTRVDKMLRADKKHTDAVDRFVAAKDREGYLKHMRAAYNSPRVKEAMSAAVRAVLPGKPGAAAKPGAKPAIVPRPGGDTTGWTRVAAKPAKDSIAHWRMTSKMLKEGKYILRDGKQVIYIGR